MEPEKEVGGIAREVIQNDSELKSFFINFVGEKFKPEDGNVTVEMCVELFAREFPEFLLLIAEENFLRGYSQGIKDMQSPVENETTSPLNIEPPNNGQ